MLNQHRILQLDDSTAKSDHPVGFIRTSLCFLTKKLRDGGVEDDDLEAFTGKEDGDKETGEENDNKKVMEAILLGHNYVGKGIVKKRRFGGKPRSEGREKRE